MVDDVEHLFFQQAARLPVEGGVHRLMAADPRQAQAFSGTQAIEFDPGILPGVFPVGHIGGGHPRHDEKPVAALDGVGVVVGIQHPPPRNDVVEQVMVAGMGTVGVQRFGALPAVLVQVQVHKAFILENMEFQLIFGLYIVVLHHFVSPRKIS